MHKTGGASEKELRGMGRVVRVEADKIDDVIKCPAVKEVVEFINILPVTLDPFDKPLEGMRGDSTGQDSYVILVG